MKINDISQDEHVSQSICSSLFGIRATGLRLDTAIGGSVAIAGFDGDLSDRTA
jgi:hypothetical protein